MKGGVLSNFGERSNAAPFSRSSHQPFQTPSQQKRVSQLTVFSVSFLLPIRKRLSAQLSPTSFLDTNRGL